MSESEHVILAGILQRPSRIVDVNGMRPEFFQGKEARGLFTYAVAYHRKLGGKNALDLPLARSRLERSKSRSSGKLLKLVGEYEGFSEISDAEFRDAVASIVLDYQREVIREHGAEAVEAILDGDWRRAKDAMREGLVEAEDADVEDSRPVDIMSREAVDEERRRVLDAKPDPIASGIDVGFSRVTDCVSLKPEELTILGGYSGDGKTQLSKAMSYNAAMRGARVLFVALEMSLKEMQTLFVAQHASVLDPRGVDYRDVLDGRSSNQEKQLYLKALDDFGSFKGGAGETSGQERVDGGAIYIWSPKRKPDMDHFMGRVRAMRAEHGINAVVADYLELIEPSKDFGQYRLNLKYMVEKGKELARDQELWVVLNHQISRKGRDDAEKRSPNHYVMRDLGESSGIERAADHVVWIYSDDDLKDANEAKVGIAKARKGRTIVTGYHVYADFPKSVLSEIGDEP